MTDRRFSALLTLPTATVRVRAKAIGGPLVAPSLPRFETRTPRVAPELRMPRLTASALSGESVVTVAQRATIEAALDDAALSLVPDEDDLAHTEDFPIPNEATKARARGLASAIAQAGFDRGASSAIPRFGAAGDGGVGLHWRSVRLELLIIVPPDESKNASYYGETVTGSPIKGTLVADGPVGFLAQWLTENELSG